MIDNVTMATLLDALSKAGALGASLIIIWLLLTEKLVPKGRLEDTRKQLKEVVDELRAQTAELKRERGESAAQAKRLTEQFRRIADQVDQMKKAIREHQTRAE